MDKFTSYRAATNYLKSKGYKVNRTSLWKDGAKIKKQADGSILVEDLDAYAEMYCKKAEPSYHSLELYEAFPGLKKSYYEMVVAKERARQLEIKNKVLEGQYVLRSDVNQQMAARAKLLKDGITNWFNSLAPRLIEKCDGNLDLVPDVMEFLAEETALFFDQYSKPIKFKVQIDEDTLH